MRGLVDGLASPHPLLGILPGLYAEDDLASRFVAAFDDALAPIFLTLDDFAAYLDPALTPEDFVPLLASWVAAFDDPRLDETRRRQLTARAVELHRFRGTAHGLAETVELACGVRPEIEESGGTSWSAQPGSAPPGSAEAGVVVRVRASDAEADVVRSIVEKLRPAHVPVRVEIIPVEGDVS
ncbi:phage tail protein [Actinopolymorpha pittospori]